MKTREELRVEYAREMHQINMQLMNYGAWDHAKIKELNDKKADLDQKRIQTFESQEEHEVQQSKLKSAKPIWGGSYSENVGAMTPRIVVEYAQKEGCLKSTPGSVIQYGWPEWDDKVQPEWKMRLEFQRLEAAMKVTTVERGVSQDEVAKLKKAWGISK